MGAERQRERGARRCGPLAHTAGAGGFARLALALPGPRGAALAGPPGAAAPGGRAGTGQPGREARALGPVRGAGRAELQPRAAREAGVRGGGRGRAGEAELAVAGVLAVARVLAWPGARVARVLAVASVLERSQHGVSHRTASAGCQARQGRVMGNTLVTEKAKKGREWGRGAEGHCVCGRKTLRSGARPRVIL